MSEDRRVSNGLLHVPIGVLDVGLSGTLVFEEVAIDGNARALVGVGHDDISAVRVARALGVEITGAHQRRTEGEAALVKQTLVVDAGLGHVGLVLGNGRIVAGAIGLEVPDVAFVVADDLSAVVLVLIDVDNEVSSDGVGVRVIDVLVEVLKVRGAGVVVESLALGMALPLVHSAANGALLCKNRSTADDQQGENDELHRELFFLMFPLGKRKEKKKKKKKTEMIQEKKAGKKRKNQNKK